MALSSSLISDFVKITKDDTSKKGEVTVFGTVVKDEGSTYVKFDGSELLTPATSTTNVEDGERVTVMIKNHSAVITGNITSPSARTDEVEGVNLEVEKVKILLSNKVSTEELEAQIARINKLEATDVIVSGDLTAVTGRIKTLETDNVAIKGKVEANEASIKTLEADNVTVKGKIEANEADIKSLDADVASIDTLIFGSASGDVIHSSFANAVIAQLGDAQIKSAMIESLSANKIMSGDIITNNIRVMSEDGALIISDETIAISDGTRVRVQIGKDASSDYSINIWDDEGDLMFSEGGITDKAIKSAIIRNDMVAANANISASKLDISSLFTALNEDGSNTLSASKVLLDADNQTVDLAFKQMTTDMSNLGSTVSTQGTDISVIQGQIKNRIWKQDVDTATGAMETKYSELKQDLDGFKSTVSDTYTTKDEANDIYATKSEVEQTAESLTVRISTAQVTADEAQSTADDAANSANDAMDTANRALPKNDFDRVVRIETDGLHVGDNQTSSEVLVDSSSVNIVIGGIKVSTFSDKYVRIDNMQVRKVAGGLAIGVYKG